MWPITRSEGDITQLPQFVESSDGKTFDITNPATLKHVAKVYEASEQDTDRAVASAKAAFPAWSALSPAQRAPCLKKLAKLIRENNDELAALEAASMGKPIGAFFDGFAAAAKFDHHSEYGHAIQGTTSKFAKIFSSGMKESISNKFRCANSWIPQYDFASAIRCRGSYYSLERPSLVPSEQDRSSAHRWQHGRCQEQ